MIKQIIITAVYFIILPICIGFKFNDIRFQKTTAIKKLSIDSNRVGLNNTPDLTDYILLEEDNFSGKSVDTTKWFYRKEGMIEDSSIYLRNNAVVKNGYLHLITNRYQNRFAGVNIASKSNYKYGYFEIRAKLPQAIGNVGAFWFQSPGMSKTFAIANPSINGVEIDVLEYSATNLDRLNHSLWWNGYDISKGAKTITSSDYIPGISKGYHTFGFEWTPKEYIIYVDNIERLRTDKIISHNEEIIILGCGTGGFGGKKNVGPWPDTFFVDYIKIYKRKPEVRLYQDCDGNGKVSDGLNAGNYTADQLAGIGVYNNRFSAIEIPKGWRVTAYEGDNFKGKTYVIKASSRCLENIITKEIYSLKIIDTKNDLSRHKEK